MNNSALSLFTIRYTFQYANWLFCRKFAQRFRINVDNPQNITKRRFKLMPILIMALMGAGIIMLVSASKDMSTYSTFAQVKRSGETAKVVGILAKDKPMYYNAEENPNLFKFYMADQEGEIHEVTLHAAKPQDFELSEQVVATGSFSGDQFIASSILMKCPSKYKNEEVLVRSNM
jgi:cytochrome c-type biogenesis protein CcmE